MIEIITSGHENHAIQPLMKFVGLTKKFLGLIQKFLTETFKFVIEISKFLIETFGFVAGVLGLLSLNNDFFTDNSNPLNQD